MIDQKARFGRVHAVAYDSINKLWIGAADPDWEGTVENHLQNEEFNHFNSSFFTCYKRSKTRKNSFRGNSFTFYWNLPVQLEKMALEQNCLGR